MCYKDEVQRRNTEKLNKKFEQDKEKHEKKKDKKDSKKEVDDQCKIIVNKTQKCFVVNEIITSEQALKCLQ